MLGGKEELCFDQENGQLYTECDCKTVTVESRIPGF